MVCYFLLLLFIFRWEPSLHGIIVSVFTSILLSLILPPFFSQDDCPKWWCEKCFSLAITYIASIVCKQYPFTCSFSSSLTFLTMLHMRFIIYEVFLLLWLNWPIKGVAYDLSEQIRDSYFTLPTVSASDLGRCHKLSQAKLFSETQLEVGKRQDSRGKGSLCEFSIAPEPITINVLTWTTVI